MSDFRKMFSAEEWEWFVKIGASYSDSEQKKVFFEAIKEKKVENPKYSLFADFPKEGLGHVPDPNLQDSPAARTDASPQNTKPRQFKGAEICQGIIEMLKPGGKSA